VDFQHKVWIVDFGSQYTQLITRKIRELGHQSIIITPKKSIELIKQNILPKVFILSGGPQSVFEDETDFSVFFENKNLPVLGICYGMQIIGQYFGGKVERGVRGEYGKALIHQTGQIKSFKHTDMTVWMSHFDHLSQPPEKFKTIFKSEHELIAGIEHTESPIVGIQFHPEVHHTEYGKEFLQWFLEVKSGLKSDWDGHSILEDANKTLEHIKDDEYILCAFSGGVDSLVAATLVERKFHKNLYCFFVDNGLLRPQDEIHIELIKKNSNLNIEVIRAKEIFYEKLKGISEPEQKRKIIGNTFIEVFEEKVHEFENNHQIHFKYLLQGTLYPDVIESISPHQKDGQSVTIKSHHNVGGLPETMKLKLLEPLRFLFKDEVRNLGQELKLPKEWLYRHPFPGPGIGVRVLGELKPEYIEKVQHSDQILFEELKKSAWYDKSWQAFTVYLPVSTVGVKGDARVYEGVICLRLVNSEDGMTAKWTPVDPQVLEKISSRITNEVKGVTRVVLDITSKPPGTIEWE
jgi:GMP synthase (glutamine-hydrolysing)